MNTFIQLQDPLNQITYSVDRKALLFKIQKDEQIEEIRLRPFHSALLGVLFDEHPKPVGYTTLKAKLKQYNLACPDVTRLHRKMSELRHDLQQINPDLEDAIQNIRGVGYSLPLNWRTPEHHFQIRAVNYKSSNIMQIMHNLEALVQESIRLSGETPILKYDDWYIQDRKPILADLEKMVARFNQVEESLVAGLLYHPTDFLMIRIQHELALLRTYIGLCRMCDYAITREQWKDWHTQEVNRAYAELQSWVKRAEV